MDNLRNGLSPASRIALDAVSARRDAERAARREARAAARARHQRDMELWREREMSARVGHPIDRPADHISAGQRMLRDDVRAEGLEAYCVNSVNPVTPNPHSIVNGTNREREVTRPTITRPPHSAPSRVAPLHAAPPPSPGTLLPRRACVRCTYDFHPKSLPSRPWGYSYCGSCHRDLNFKYCRALRARKVKLKRAYLISRGDLAPDAELVAGPGSPPSHIFGPATDRG